MVLMNSIEKGLVIKIRKLAVFFLRVRRWTKVKELERKRIRDVKIKRERVRARERRR